MYRRTGAVPPALLAMATLSKSSVPMVLAQRVR